MLRQALTTDLVSLQSIQPTFHHTELLETYDVEHPLRQAKLTLRIKQATQYLAAVREAVAEKSFQY